MNENTNNNNLESFNTNTNINTQVQNNQNLNNQFNQNIAPNTNVNQSTVNQLTQSTSSFQQPINQVNMQQPAPQPVNAFESGNTNNGNFSSKPPKKKKLVFIIGIVIAIIVIIALIIILNVSKSNDKNNSTQKPSELYTYSDLFNNSSIFESSLCFSLDNRYSVRYISNNSISLDYVDNEFSYNVSIAEYANFDDSAMFHYGLNYDVNNVKTILDSNELKFKVLTDGKTYLNDNYFVHYCNYDYLHNGKVISISGSICDPTESYSQERIEQIKSIFVDKDNCVNVYDKLARIPFLSEYYIKDTTGATIFKDDISLSFKNYGISICISGNDCHAWITDNYSQQKKYGNLEISWESIEHSTKLLVKNITTNEELILLIGDSYSSTGAPSIDESYSIFNQIFIKK